MKTLIPEHIPAELRDLPRWVVADGTKVPYSPTEPTRKASTADSSTWSGFETARQLVERRQFPMLGFVLGAGFVGVDLDECRHPETGAIEPLAQDIIDRLNSYTERSVSGTGIHVICRGRLPQDGRKKNGVEMYAAKHYFVVTGNLEGTLKPIEDRTAELAALYAEVFGNDADGHPKTSFSQSNDTDRTDDEVLGAARAARNGTKFQCLWSGDTTMHNGDDSAADLALCGQLARWTQDRAQIDRLFRRSGLYRRDKWERQDYRDRTIAKALQGGRCSTDSRPANSHSAKKNDATSQQTALVKLMTQSGAEFFHASDGQPFVTLTIDGHQETMSLKSQFQHHLAGAFYRATGHVATASAVKDAVAVMSAMARDGAQHPVFVRVARTDNAIWLDLGRSDWNMVKVTTNGWSVVSMPDVRFRRPKGLLALPEPTHGCETLPTLLTKLVNCHDERDVQLLSGWLVGALRGKGPYPVLSVNGEQGSAKSTACRVLRRLIDPNPADLRSTPRDPRDLMIMANSSHVLAFDNLSHIEDWFSDALCRLATGGGFSTRQLFTDDDEVLFAAERPVIVNGITEVVSRPDLLNRAVVVTLEPIPNDERRREAELDAQFNDMHPTMLGALLDAVSMALRHEATTRLPELPRLADFVTWVEAAGPALGWKPREFYRAFCENQQVAVENVLDGDVVVDTLRGLPPAWTGTLAGLLNQIPEGEFKPKSPKALKSALKRKAPALRQIGIDVDLDAKRVGSERHIEIRRTSGGATGPVRSFTLPVRRDSLHGTTTGIAALLVAEPDDELAEFIAQTR